MVGLNGLNLASPFIDMGPVEGSSRRRVKLNQVQHGMGVSQTLLHSRRPTKLGFESIMTAKHM